MWTEFEHSPDTFQLVLICVFAVVKQPLSLTSLWLQFSPAMPRTLRLDCAGRVDVTEQVPECHILVIGCYMSCEALGVIRKFPALCWSTDFESFSIVGVVFTRSQLRVADNLLRQTGRALKWLDKQWLCIVNNVSIPPAHGLLHDSKWSVPFRFDLRKESFVDLIAKAYAYHERKQCLTS